jgi:gas vesicle protein
VSNPTYGQGSDPTATGGSGADAPEPYASDQPVSTDPYTDVPAQPTDVSYGTVDQPYTGSYDESMSSSSSTKDVAKGEAGAVKDTAVGAGKNVASTARDEAANVVSQAGSQAKNLLSTFTDEVRSQGRTQQSRLAEAVHSVSQELGSMGAKSEQSGPVADLAQQASRKTGELGHWLENKEPAEVLEDLRSFARRRPAMFLGLSALAGVVVGRLGRGAVAANTSRDSKDDYGYSGSYSGTPSAYATTAPDTGYSTGYETGYSDTGSYGGTSATGPSTGGYAAGTMPETGGTYAGDEGLQAPYGGQDDLNR